LDALQPDAHTAIVALSHDSKIDDPALDRALHSPAFYIGALGSRKTHAARLERLRALGHREAALSRIDGPVGLAIGAVTTPEIALSIITAIIAQRRLGGQASGSFFEKKEPKKLF
jgi:xanthine dehydrogenase accessory factor